MKKDVMSKEEATVRLMVVLSRHVGEEKAIDMGDLYQRVFDRPCDHKINHTRELRKLITMLRREGVPIGSTSVQNGGGYYLCRAGSELNTYCDRLIRRGINALDIVSKLRKVALPELLGQMRLSLAAESQEKSPPTPPLEKGGTRSM